MAMARKTSAAASFAGVVRLTAAGLAMAGGLSIGAGMLPVVSSASASDVVTVDGGPKPAINATTRPRKIAAVIVRYADTEPGQAVSPLEARLALSGWSMSPVRFFAANSGGRIKLVGDRRPEGDVFGPVTVDALAPTCTGSDLLSRGIATLQLATHLAAAVQSAGIDVSRYDHVVFYPPGSGDDRCRRSFGIPNGSAAVVWGHRSAAGTSYLAGVTSHEVGHNFGLPHANRLACPAPFGSPDGICETYEYGDGDDLMGPEGRMLNGFSRAQIGALPTAQVQKVDGASLGRSIRIYRLNHATATDTKLVMIYRSNPALPRTACDFAFWWDCPTEQHKRWLTLEYVTSKESSDVTESGVAVRLTGDVWGTGSPLRVEPYGVRLLAQDGSFFDQASQRLVVVDHRTPEYVDVRVFGADRVPPATPVPSANATEPGLLRWAPVTDNAGRPSYVVESDRGPGTAIVQRLSVSAADCFASATGRCEAELPSGLRARVTAVDLVGNRSAPSAWITIRTAGGAQ
jgi:hypothetical protein